MQEPLGPLNTGAAAPAPTAAPLPATGAAPASAPLSETAGSLQALAPSEVTDTTGQVDLPLAFFPLQGAVLPHMMRYCC